MIRHIIMTNSLTDCKKHFLVSAVQGDAEERTEVYGLVRRRSTGRVNAAMCHQKLFYATAGASLAKL